MSMKLDINNGSFIINDDSSTSISKEIANEINDKLITPDNKNENYKPQNIEIKD